MENVLHSPEAAGCSYAIMNCHYVRYPVEYFLDSVKRFGFANIELFGALPHFYIEDVDDELIGRVTAGCRQRGLNIVSYTPAQGAYPVSISIDEKTARSRSIRMAKKSIETAEKLGAATMLISPGFGYQNQPHEARWYLCREALEELAEHAQAHNIILMIEPLTPTTSNVINTSEQSAKMIAEVGSPNLKSMMDIGVMNFMGESVDSYFANLGENLAYIHFTDGPGMHVALGDGTFPMVDYLKQIRQHGYHGYLSFEINDKRYLRDPDSATQKNVSWLKKNGFIG
ncbi:MAG: TIM barrel protein [Clostridiaceae bacterium]